MNFNIDEGKKNLIISLIVPLIILIIDIAFIMRPQIAISKKLSPQLSSLSRDVKLARLDNKQKESFEKRFEAAKAKMLELNLKIPKGEDVSFILNEISLISKESNVKIAELKPLKDNQAAVLKTNMGIYYKLPIYIVANCGYHDFGVFLNNIEYSDIFMKTSEMEINENQNDPRMLTVKLILECFIIEKK